MEFYKLINKELLNKYGYDSLKRPMYQLVQNYNLTEKRFGSMFYGDIELPNKEAIIVPKYNYVPEGYWILEKLFNTTNPELVNNFSYEPLWIFRSAEGAYQAPNLKACIFVIESALRGPAPIQSEEEIKKKESEKFFEMLGGKAGISDDLHAKSAVSYSGLDAKGGPDTPVQNKES